MVIGIYMENISILELRNTLFALFYVIPLGTWIAFEFRAFLRL